MPGGCSWTSNWLHFDNEYFKRVVRAVERREKERKPLASNGSRILDEPHLLWLPIDAALFECPEYRPYFMRYARSLDDFHRDYSAAHIKMSELGAKFRYRLVLDFIQ